MTEEKMTWVKFHGISTDKALDIYQTITGCSDHERHMKVNQRFKNEGSKQDAT
jgi:hypothetical protein